MVDGEAGDLKFVVTSQPHPRFQRDGNDLRYNASISLVEALVGFSKQVRRWPALQASHRARRALLLHVCCTPALT